MHFIWMIIIGGVAGMLAGKITKGKGFGIIMDVVLGICGAVLSGWLFSLLHITILKGYSIGEFISALLGSLLILFVIKKIKN